MNKTVAVILATGAVLGLTLLGTQLGNAIITFKTWDRVVTVKGLSEREYLADKVIWPIQFTEAGNDLSALHRTLKQHTQSITQYLHNAGLDAQSITVGAPEIIDKLAQRYGGERTEFRYSAIQTITVYSTKIEFVRGLMASISELVSEGIVFTSPGYEARTEYLFSRLNEVKPVMIEEATKHAREVANKFAQDSDSKLGKINQARQGQFSIFARDNHHPHIKKVRVVSTIEYTLVD
ncbi:SIMPL domain-containing protein [Alteromonas ponticola]|uniref:SIMPL domain-containing protein n=1 Tax=Alteromonas ponticola TaxID=2720613 RepID=A0ABX1QY75_9ALTE|nr:SIMPL domain-containing protein [Alteromonas ponticola]NMH59180.1 SIMPL domain-containing protein [Alteromonas ponticola]